MKIEIRDYALLLCIVVGSTFAVDDFIPRYPFRLEGRGDCHTVTRKKKKKRKGNVLFIVGDIFSDALLYFERGECKKYSSIIDYFTNYYQFLSRSGEKTRVRIIINIISSLAFDAIQYAVNKLLYHVYSVLKRIKTDNEYQPNFRSIEN